VKLYKSETFTYVVYSFLQMVSISFAIVITWCFSNLFLGDCNMLFGGWLHRLHHTKSNGWPRCRAGQVGVHHFAGKLLSRTEEGLPGADAKLQEASEYSVIGHLLLSLGIIFII